MNKTRFLIILFVFGLPSSAFAELPWQTLVDDAPTKPITSWAVPPSGFERVEVKAKSFGAFLRTLSIRTDRTTVQSYKGQDLASPSAGIVHLNVGKRNLQQCADSAIRLHAEWLWSQKRVGDVAYHFTSGDLSTWSRWAKGERFKVSGPSVKRVQTKNKDRSYGNFQAYLRHVFMYAGTRSLARDSEPVELGDVNVGDFFVSPGSPGHAVVVLDVVRKDGKRLALIGQGFMPAQEFHVVKSAKAINGIWFPIPTDKLGSVDTPSWDAFPISTLRRFKAQ